MYKPLLAYDIRFPNKKSELDGWQGISMKKIAPKGCELIFPNNFGHKNKKQLLILRELVNRSVNLEHDLDCALPIEYNALDQIKNLAINKQDKNAALMLLDWSTHGGFNLDGELAEEYVGEYEIPVLLKFKKLHSIVNDKNEQIIADDICNWFDFNKDRKLLKTLLAAFRKNNLNNLADKIVRKCR
jgi:hypothetical protein